MTGSGLGEGRCPEIARGILCVTLVKGWLAASRRVEGILCRTNRFWHAANLCNTSRRKPQDSEDCGQGMAKQRDGKEQRVSTCIYAGSGIASYLNEEASASPPAVSMRLFLHLHPSLDQ